LKKKKPVNSSKSQESPGAVEKAHKLRTIGLPGLGFPKKGSRCHWGRGVATTKLAKILLRAKFATKKGGGH